MTFIRKSKKRDVQIHAAVTIMNRENDIEVIGEKPLEIAQYAVQLDGRFGPFTRSQFETAFSGLLEHCLVKAREAGCLRAGQ